MPTQRNRCSGTVTEPEPRSAVQPSRFIKNMRLNLCWLRAVNLGLSRPHSPIKFGDELSPSRRFRDGEVLLSRMKIYVSGLFRRNPQQGVGIVRSLRQGYPNATLIGVEYSNRVSGYIGRISTICGSSGRGTSSTRQLWRKGEGDARRRAHSGSRAATSRRCGSPICFPTATAICLRLRWRAEADRKAGRRAHDGLPVRIPTYISTDLSDWDLHAFCRKHNWRCG